VSSGQAAETIALLNITEAGDHIVSSSSLYGGTYNLGPTPKPASTKRSPTPKMTFSTSKPWRRWP
jgi:hypothetical protein